MPDNQQPNGQGGKDFNINLGVSAGVSPRAQKWLAGILALAITGGGGTSIVVAYNSLHEKYINLNQRMEEKNEKLEKRLQEVEKDNAGLRHTLTDVGALLEKTSRSVKSPSLRRELEEQAQKIKDKMKQSSELMMPDIKASPLLPATVEFTPFIRRPN